MNKETVIKIILIVLVSLCFYQACRCLAFHPKIEYIDDGATVNLK